mmetsp:Transcript_22528/g.40114  ORF Transcript_22528/g.40114 Transcript_22528/m.40114 type:complete len:207 (+) Transcript_22528:1563-2183(+)
MSSYAGIPPKLTAGDEGAPADVASVFPPPDLTSSSTSAATMRPPGPDPATPSRLTFPSRANRFAIGLAITRLPLATAFFAAGASLLTGVAEGAAALSDDVLLAAGAAEVEDSSPVKLAKAATSLSSSTITAISVPTLMPSVPCGTSIFARKPSSWLSQSMAALSVSIIAKESPAATASPTCFFHSEIFPCSIVGERDGISSFRCGG